MMVRSPLGRVLMAMRPDPGRLLLATITGSAALASAIALIGTSGWLISRAAQQPPVLYLMVAIVAVRSFGIGRGILRYAERLSAHDVALRGVVTLREKLYAALAAGDPMVAAGLRRGDLLARVGADVDALGDVVVRSLLPFATCALTSALSVVALALVLPQAGLILAVALLTAGIAAPLLAAVAAHRSITDAATTRTAMSEQVVALLDGLPELTVAGLVYDRAQQLDRTDRALSLALDRAARPAGWSAALATVAMGAAVLGCLAVGVAAVADGRLAPVMLAVVALIPLAVAEVVAPLPAAATGLVRASAAARRVVTLLDTPVRPARENPSAVGSSPVLSPRPRLRAENLTCGWPDRPPTLAHLDLDLAPGRRIAIVGPSGEGKSTLLRTLAGLLPARTGRVTLDGTDIALLEQVSLRRAVSLTTDDAYIFSTTVRENVRVAHPGADDTAVRRALHRAGLGEWLADLPGGLDTLITDPAGPGPGPGAGGRSVSGGERRRLLLARALISAAGVLLVDEPAEHLDPATADALVAELFADGATVVVVTHRLTPLTTADEILVLAGGTVAARGTHDQLVANHPPYRDAWLAERPLDSRPASDPQNSKLTGTGG